MRRLLIISLLLASLSGFAQLNTEQLKRMNEALAVIDANESDTGTANAYLDLGELLYISNLDTLKILCLRSLDIVDQNIERATEHEKRTFLKTKATALNNIGYVFSQKGDKEKALEYYLKSLSIKEEIGDKGGIAKSMNNIGYQYKIRGEIEKALSYYEKSLTLKEELGDTMGIAVTYYNLANIYDDQEQYEMSITYFQKSLKIREEFNDRIGIAACLNRLGEYYFMNGELERALQFYHRGLSISESIHDQLGISEAVTNMANLFSRQNRYDKAIEQYVRSLRISKEVGDLHSIAVSFNYLGRIYGKLGRMDEAFAYADSSFQLALEINIPMLMKSITFLMYSLEKSNNNWKRALDMYEIHIKMRDSLKNEETEKATIRQQTKYEFEKAQLIKEQMEKETNRRRQEIRSRRDNLQYSVILIAILILFGGVLALGFINVSERMAEGIIFFSFLIFFEFILVLADPYIENWSGGAPGIKLLFNAGIAALIFPLHAFFEAKLKGRLKKTEA